MKTINFTEILDELNGHVLNIDEQSEICFSYLTNGYDDGIVFGENIIWSSADDDREWIEQENDYEDFLPFIKNKFNEYLDYQNKLRF